MHSLFKKIRRKWKGLCVSFLNYPSTYLKRISKLQNNFPSDSKYVVNDAMGNSAEIDASFMEPCCSIYVRRRNLSTKNKDEFDSGIQMCIDDASRFIGRNARRFMKSPKIINWTIPSQELPLQQMMVWAKAYSEEFVVVTVERHRIGLLYEDFTLRMHRYRYDDRYALCNILPGFLTFVFVDPVMDLFRNTPALSRISSAYDAFQASKNAVDTAVATKKNTMQCAICDKCILLKK